MPVSKNRLNLTIDRTARVPLAQQIYSGIASAIHNGVLPAGYRLPSWIDLAAQLGVSRGTVKTAYERLADTQQVTTARAKGTCVAGVPPASTAAAPAARPGSSLYRDFFFPDGHFRMGIPASDAFPSPLFARLFAASARAGMAARQCYADPRGEALFRQEIAAQLALSRGITCHPSRVFITAGFTGALGVILHALALCGKTCWVENPGFPPARRALELAGMALLPVPVDEEGINVSAGLQAGAGAALALVTPGQQAPLGMPLSLARRRQLLAWAERNQSWIIEDDYLGDLQLTRRAAPALAAMDTHGRVIHVGSFSKTLSPGLRLGFIVAPPALAETLADVVASLAPAPDPAVQLATQRFLHEGHFLRHLRKMKRTYSARSSALLSHLNTLGYCARVNGLSVLLNLPDGAQDIPIAREAWQHGLAPSPLSAWYTGGDATPAGLLLGIADAQNERTYQACERLDQLIRKQLAR
ncbi:transcriptional regulator [Shimwellia blattae DSM 4481 = NBRC 105725]|uniref:Transcriptional regulator n=1 Tax=Shimwellia blattae (strain ATCC 29907 / DSM 4481 / JCM 1650 / NBRC 105725 / CDC 9005-74) TaxID=630626 RepID=I2B5E7_SHIBC|nr:PLP-dependent aminotransferase family protein [Shimwellia blattae]AFJ45751.1 transcriptional regulator [Shimwellia blattae DSM 4481 = NBRC 105725]GAB82199.1 putative GntR family transcriptional regulator [Shimwellia blattae DSM 4481 = NBRC 105725]VEC20933.1 HTH-type transcriptional regulatory protein gabR [Shimwellia blattae]